MGFASAPTPASRPDPSPCRVGHRRWRAGLAALALVGCAPGPTPAPAPRLALSRLDPRLAPLHEAAVRWDARLGPARAVVDQVALVPDVPTFLRAIRGWDRDRFYPILIESDVESTLRFLRAFHPARVVRVARVEAASPTPDALWRVAGASVAASWRAAGSDGAIRSDDLVREPRPPEDLGPTPPGVVVSHPESPTLAAAAALAAGHWQPLVRLDPNCGFYRTLAPDEFRAFDRAVDGAVVRAAPSHLGLGDDCDFVTLAGDYPYRYRDERGEDEAVDDAIARDPATGARWAFAGRLVGDPARGVARAMAALFLRPESTTLFNGYDEATLPWSVYATRDAAGRLGTRLPTRQFAGPDHGTVAAWAEAFDPENRSGLVWINSHGTPAVFHLRDEPVSAAEIPRTVPAAVVMIHSFSASDPTDPDTIAGRWLANGAFVYFGSINEPFIQAFRTPDLALGLALDGLPLVACLRVGLLEPFGTPWRLVYLGDPLYRISGRPAAKPGDGPSAQGGTLWGDAPTRTSPPPTAPSDWTVVASDRGRGFDPPPREAPEALAEAWDLALVASARGGDDPADQALIDAIVRASAVDRDRLAPADRARLDSIRADLLFRANRRGELRTRIEAIPPAERSPEIRRWHDAIRSSDLAWHLGGGDFDRTLAAWDRLVGSDAMAAAQVHATDRVGAVVHGPERRRAWASALRRALDRPLSSPVSDAVRRELERAEGATRAVAAGR